MSWMSRHSTEFWLESLKNTRCGVQRDLLNDFIVWLIKFLFRFVFCWWIAAISEKYRRTKLKVFKFILNVPKQNYKLQIHLWWKNQSVLVFCFGNHFFENNLLTKRRIHRTHIFKVEFNFVLGSLACFTEPMVWWFKFFFIRSWMNYGTKLMNCSKELEVLLLMPIRF